MQESANHYVSRYSLYLHHKAKLQANHQQSLTHVFYNQPISIPLISLQPTIAFITLVHHLSMTRFLLLYKIGLISSTLQVVPTNTLGIVRRENIVMSP